MVFNGQNNRIISSNKSTVPLKKIKSYERQRIAQNFQNFGFGGKQAANCFDIIPILCIFRGCFYKSSRVKLVNRKIFIIVPYSVDTVNKHNICTHSFSMSYNWLKFIFFISIPTIQLNTSEKKLPFFRVVCV